LKKLQAGRPKGVKKLDGLDGLDSLCGVGDEAVDFAVKAILQYFLVFWFSLGNRWPATCFPTPTRWPM
jgi:hypothetical protein